MHVQARLSHRGILALLAGAAVIVLGFTSLVNSETASADAVVTQPGELVVNGGGEQPVSVGWTGSLGRATHGSSGYPASVIVGPSGLTGASYPGGRGLLTGAGGSSVATQKINLAPSAAAIDNGVVDAKLSAYIGGYSNQADNARLTYTFFDASDNAVNTVTFGPVLPANRGNISGFVPFAETVRLPVGTRSATVTITTQRFIAPANDGYTDNVSLILDAPSPTAAPDTASTEQGTPVTVDPLGNDAPGTGAELVPGSVRLLKGSAEVTTLATQEGTYTVAVETGQIVFTPAPGYLGTTTAVPYRISDSSGQQAESTVTIEVVFVARPGLDLVKSASPTDPADYVLGAGITYSFLITNVGNVLMTDVAVAETAFSGAGEIPVASCPATTLTPGAQMTCKATYTLIQADIDNRGITNTATASAIPDGSATPFVSEPSQVDVPVAGAPALELVKSADTAGSTAAGDTIEYSFLLTNRGNVTLDSISIVEVSFTGTGALPEVACPATTLEPGASTTCSAPYTLTQQDVDAGTIANTAIALANDRATPVSSNRSAATVAIAPQPGITLVKTSTTQSIIRAGQTVDYLFQASNTGNITLTGITIDDTAFTGSGTLGPIDCGASTAAPGETIVCATTYTATQADIDAGGELSNTATSVATAPGDDKITSTPSTATIAVEQTPALTVVKSTNVKVAAVGQTVTYSFLITNTGNVTITNPTVSEGEFSGTGELSAVTCPDDDTINPAENLTCTAAYTVTQADIDSGALTNTATATGNTPGGSTMPPSSPSTVEITTDPLPALSVVKTANLHQVTAVGQVVTYSFLATNVGNVTINNITVNEGPFNGYGALSAANCPNTEAPLLPGSSITCTATYTVVAADLANGENLTNTAIISGTTANGDAITSPPSTATIHTSNPPAHTADTLAATGPALLGPSVALALLLLALSGGFLGLHRRQLTRYPQ